MFFNLTINQRNKIRRTIADHCNKIGLMFSEHDGGVFVRHPHSGGFWIVFDRNFLKTKALVYQAQFSNVRFMAPVLLYKGVHKRQIVDLLDRFKDLRIEEYMENIPSSFTMHMTLSNVPTVDICKTTRRVHNAITRKATYSNRYVCLSFFSNHSVASRRLMVKYRRDEDRVILAEITGCESLHPLEVVLIIDKIVSIETPHVRSKIIIDPMVLSVEARWALDWINTDMARERLHNRFVQTSENLGDLYLNGSYRTIKRKEMPNEENYTPNLALITSLSQS